MYNTALGRKPNHEMPAIHDVFKSPDGKITVLQNDLCAGISPEYYAASVIYSEPPWHSGYDKFAKNTIADGTSYRQYIDGFERLIRVMALPALLVCGKSDLKQYCPSDAINITFIATDTCSAKLLVYNPVLLPFDYKELDGKTSKEVCEIISAKCKCVLDPSCGYGNVVRNNGADYVLSDIDTDCLLWLRKEYANGLCQARG